MSASRREQAHARIAIALERHFGESSVEHAPEIAQHLVAAGPSADPEKLAAFARHAAERAAAVCAWNDAAQFYAAAAEAASVVGDLSAGERAELHYRAGLYFNHDWDPAPCVEQYERAVELYRHAGDQRGLVLALCYRTRADFTFGPVEYGQSIELGPLERALDALGEREPAVRASALQTLSEGYWVARDLDRAMELAVRARELADRIADDPLRRDACLALGLVQLQRLEVSDALETYRDALACAERTGDPWLSNVPRNRLAIPFFLLGRVDEASKLASRCLELTRRVQDTGEASMAAASAVVLAAARGDIDSAELNARDAIAQIERSQYSWSGLIMLTGLAAARALAGAWPDAEDALRLLADSSRGDEKTTPEARLFAVVHRELIGALERPFEREEGKRLRDLLAVARLAGEDARALSVLCALVELADLRCDPELASYPRMVLSRARERGVVLAAPWPFLIPRVLGVAAMLAENWGDAEACFEQALDIGLRVGAEPEVARTHWSYARMLLARGGGANRSGALELLERAHAASSKRGWEPLSRQAAALLGRSEASPPQDRGALTTRETELLRRVTRGEPEVRIASDLLLSEPTVRQHLARVYRKIGAEGRTTAAGYAIASGLLPDLDTAHARPLVILVSDLEGFTPMVERLGDASAREVIHEHNWILRELLSEHRGRELTHTGDGLITSFESAADAVRCAIQIQRALSRYSADHPENPLRIRLGINAGQALVADDQPFGTCINAACRICGAAAPGQILVSDGVRQLLSGAGVPFADRGMAKLKGLAKPIHVHEVPWSDTMAGS